MVQASPAPSPSKAHSLLLSPFVHAFPAQIGSLWVKVTPVWVRCQELSCWN